MPKSKHWKYDSYCEYRNERGAATSHYRRTERISDESFHKRIKKCQEAFEKDADTYKSNMADSFLQQNDSANGLTGPQVESLKRWEESIEGAAKWRDIYRKSPTKKELFSFAALYFSETGYFSKITRAYYADVEGYIPTFFAYNKLVENTYFQRWLPEVKAGPRFSVGDIVEGRAGNYDHASAVYLITKVLGKIDPCKGGRWYNGHVIKDTGRYSSANRRNDNGEPGARGFREKDVKPLKKGKKK